MILFKAFSADLFPLKCGLRSHSDVANTLKRETIDICLLLLLLLLSKNGKPTKKQNTCSLFACFSITPNASGFGSLTHL